MIQRMEMKFGDGNLNSNHKQEREIGSVSCPGNAKCLFVHLKMLRICCFLPADPDSPSLAWETSSSKFIISDVPTPLFYDGIFLF